MINSTISIVIFIVVEFFLCCLLALLFNFVDNTTGKRKENIRAIIPINFLSIIALLVWYYSWNPTTLLIVEGDSKEHITYNRYFVLSKTAKKDGVDILNSGDTYSNYIYNGSKFPLLLTSFMYTKSYSSIYRPYNYIIYEGNTKNVPTLPDYYFESPPSHIFLKKNEKAVRWMLDIINTSEEY